jgi:allantoinase
LDKALEATFPANAKIVIEAFVSKAQFGIMSRRVLTPEGINQAVVLIENGKIVGVTHNPPSGIPIDDVGDDVVMPGLVDCHVHVNEPGRTDWEGFETATRAAAAGGITTIVDMPLNSDPVTTTLPALETKLEVTDKKLWVDAGFWGGIVPGNAGSLESMIDAGVRGFKCFLIHSGIDDFPNVTEADLRLAMPILARRRVPLLVHAELECGESCEWENGARSYKDFLRSRPRRWENEAIKLMIDLAREYGTAVHIVHLSSSDAIPLVAAAKLSGLSFSAETCPHYLTFAAEEIADGDSRFKCAPPIRERENQEKLWSAVQDGTIDFIVSDHSPCAPELKFLPEGDLKRAWGGISSLQFGLSTVWTEASRRGVSIQDLYEWMSRKTAAFVKLDDRKGRLAPAHDADIVVWSPEQKQTVEPSMIQHRHKVTPYDGRELLGVVKQTYVRGNKVFDNGKFATEPVGQTIVSN